MIEVQDIIKLLLAIILGGLIGLEREINHKAAGFRTNILICIGSMLYTVISIKLGTSNNDTGRIAAQIVTGVGFLGAGAILKEGATVMGLTTAASIWVVSSIGMGVGCGYYGLSILVTVGIVIMQMVFSPLEPYLDKFKYKICYNVTFNLGDDEIDKNIKQLLNSLKIVLLHFKISKKNNLMTIEYCTSGTQKAQQLLISKILEIKEIIELHY